MRYTLPRTGIVHVRLTLPDGDYAVRTIDVYLSDFRKLCARSGRLGLVLSSDAINADARYRSSTGSRRLSPAIGDKRDPREGAGETCLSWRAGSPGRRVCVARFIRLKQRKASGRGQRPCRIGTGVATPLSRAAPLSHSSERREALQFRHRPQVSAFHEDCSLLGQGHISVGPIQYAL